MSASRTNNPVEKVRELQRKLFMAAKRKPGRRFHALFDRSWRDDVLEEAWRRVKDIREVIQDLNPVLRGWGNYFRTGNASDKFQPLDRYVEVRLVGLLRKRGGQRRARTGAKPFNPREWPHVVFAKKHGLYKLLGTIRYPGGAHAA